MSREDVVLHFNYIMGVLGIAVPMAVGLVLRDIERDIANHSIEDTTFYSILLRFVARISGSTAGAWFASAVVISFGYGWLQYPAIGLGAVLGWKILDATARSTLYIITNPLKEILKR